MQTEALPLVNKFQLTEDPDSGYFFFFPILPFADFFFLSYYFVLFLLIFLLSLMHIFGV